jgi:hypothetical protein
MERLEPIEDGPDFDKILKSMAQRRAALILVRNGVLGETFATPAAAS